jgi:hypothetical protein
MQVNMSRNIRWKERVTRVERRERGRVWCGNLKQRDNLKNLGVNDRMILKLNLKK